MDSINLRLPFEAIIFDVSMDRGVRFASERLTEIMYRALLRELGYCEDFDLAELEIALETDGRLEAFEKSFEKIHDGKSWRKRRQLGLAINEASAALHQLDPKTYPTADSYAVATGKGRADIDPNKLARRAFDARDFDTAIRHLKFAVRKKPSEASFSSLMARCYLGKGDERAAHRWQARAEELAASGAPRRRHARTLDTPAPDAE